MKKIYLRDLDLKVFTEQDALDYCNLNNLNFNSIDELNLNWNELTDISGIKLFKNLKILDLNHNKITDISVLKDLNKLKYIGIGYNKITDISAVKYLNNLQSLDICYNLIKDIFAIKDLNKLKKLSIVNLELESDQIQYINSLNNLYELYCEKGFKNMSVLNQLNNNIAIMK